MLCPTVQYAHLQFQKRTEVPKVQLKDNGAIEIIKKLNIYIFLRIPINTHTKILTPAQLL